MAQAVATADAAGAAGAAAGAVDGGSTRSAGPPTHDARDHRLELRLIGRPAQALLRRLAIFAGGWTLEAAETLCALAGDSGEAVLPALWALAEKSLLRAPEHIADEPRFAMLETVRDYALEQLAAHGETEVLRGHHAALYVALAEQAEPQLEGPEQVAWVARLEREHDNLRAALTWAMEDGAERGVLGLRLAAALWRFWYLRGHLSEGRRWLEGMLATGGACRRPGRGLGYGARRALQGAGALAYAQGDYAQATLWLEESLALCRARDDTRGSAAALNRLGLVAANQGQYARAIALYEESLALKREMGDTRGIALTLDNLGKVAHAQGDYGRATALYAESLVLCGSWATRGASPAACITWGRSPRTRGRTHGPPSCRGRAWSCSARWTTGGASPRVWRAWLRWRRPSPARRATHGGRRCSWRLPPPCAPPSVRPSSGWPGAHGVNPGAPTGGPGPRDIRRRVRRRRSIGADGGSRTGHGRGVRAQRLVQRGARRRPGRPAVHPAAENPQPCATGMPLSLKKSLRRTRHELRWPIRPSAQDPVGQGRSITHECLQKGSNARPPPHSTSGFQPRLMKTIWLTTSAGRVDVRMNLHTAAVTATAGSLYPNSAPPKGAGRVSGDACAHADVAAPGEGKPTIRSRALGCAAQILQCCYAGLVSLPLGLHALGDLKEVAAGIVEDRRDDRAHRDRLLRERDPLLFEPYTLVGDILYSERGRRDAIAPQRGTIGRDSGMVSGLEHEFRTVGIVRRDDGQPARCPQRDLGLLHEAQHPRIEFQGLILVVHVQAA